MDLGNIFKKQDKAEVEHFWTLVIGRSWVEAGIWRVVDEKTEVVAEGSGSSWEEDEEETLVQAADSALSAAAGSFEEEVEEPSKVVFGLPPSWVEEGTIRKDKLGLLKKLSKELELSPAGFVILPEAIAHYLKIKEGAPLSAILVGVAEDTIDLNVVQNGKILGTEEIAKSISLGSDVTEGLARFKISQFPSRIILYDHRTADLEDAKQNLLETEWEDEKIKFLHTPRVEILQDDALVSAVSLAGGAEVGQAKSVESLVSAEKEVDEEETEAPEETSPQEELREVSPEELGFLRGEDIAQKEPPAPSPQPSQPPKPVLEEKKLPRTGISLSGALTNALKAIKLPRPSFSFSGRRNLVGVVSVALLGIFLMGGLAYWYLPRATVTVYVAPKRLERDISFTVNTETDVISNERRVVPGRFASAEISGEKTKSTTGTKTVGERAKGEVTIYRTGPTITLPTGTILTAPNDLRFTLDSQAQIASGSAARPGEANASITAADIGAQYNLAAETVFSVANFSESDLQAENSAALSGGSSREISAVSEEDRETLEEELASELTNKGLENIKSGLTEGEILIAESVKLRSVEKSFSHKLGDEADTLKLSMSAGAEALVLPKDAINGFLASELREEVPEGFVLRQEQIQSTFKIEEEGSATKEVSAHVVANLLPQVNPEDISRNIAGKYPDIAKNYLSSIPGFTRAEIAFSISFPGRLKTLPRLARNIVVEVAAER